MRDENAHAAICRYLRKQHVLTLCTGPPLWCANCFYVFDKASMAFWLMTESRTRHGVAMLAQPQVAGTVNGQPRNVKQIKGVQYQGEIHQLTGTEAEQARSIFIQRFPVAAAASTPVWAIVLSELKMTDNTLGFGKKLYWRSDR